MKTAKQTNQHLPRFFILFLYMCVVAILCFFNCMAMNAQAGQVDKHVNHPLYAVPGEVYEPDLELQDWMINLEYGYLSAGSEPEISVEPWMLSFSPDYMKNPADTSEIGFEPWMVNFERRCLRVDAEDDIPVASWMVRTSAWERYTDLLTKQ
jgi:hypothetical protein